MRIKQNVFSGERPRVASPISREYEAQIAENCDLSRGHLRALKNNARIENLTETGDVQSLYLWKKSGDDEWIAHTSALDFCRSPLAGEAHDRVYYAGLDEPRVLSTSNLSVPFDFSTDYYKLGVPAPTAAIDSLTGYSGGGSGYRAYIYTYVVKLGTTDAEEGSNSAIAEISDYTSGDVTLGGFTAPPTGRSIGKIRIYRTASSSSGVAEFLFVGEFDTAGVDFSSYTFTDNVSDADLGEAFACENWSVPPTTLSGLIAPDGGSLAGFVGNRVYVSEPYLPHAWPYSYPVDGTIIGLGHIGNTIVVLTDESIYLMSGQADALSTQKIPGRYPCSSKASIVSCENGVFFASPEGIVLVTLDGPTLYSYEYFTQQQYSDNYSPSAIRAAFYNGQYIAFHNNGAFAINTRDQSMVRLSAPLDAAAPHISLSDSRLYFVYKDVEGVNAIYEFADDDAEDYMQYRYRSKEYILPGMSNFSAVRVIRDVSEFQAINTEAFESGADGVVNGEEVNAGVINGDGTTRTYLGVMFRLYGDGILLHEQEITDDQPFRLPADNLYRRCYYELSGDTPIDEVAIATSMEELDAA